MYYPHIQVFKVPNTYKNTDLENFFILNLR